MEQSTSSLAAALKCSKQIGCTIMSLTFSLIAVLIPLLFMCDVAGRLFREFAIILAVTILICGLVSLTITSMLHVNLLSHIDDDQHGCFERAARRVVSCRRSSCCKALV
ncbi:efflux RND transporter permease subunit, partial [Pseudomonas aeruginosa]|uniref:efflux RND transporter permease subunit n=1 Tax=Pseudomonas aeruginosa TaxID=287 RepID=UPI0027E5A97B